MTVLGKILVFVNLAFSVLVCGLLVVVFTARTNFADALNKSEALRRMDQEAAKAKINETVALKAEAAKLKEDLEATLKKVQGDLEKQIAINQSYKDKVAADLQDRDKAGTIKQAAQAEVLIARNGEQNAIKRAELANAQIVDLVKERNKLKDDALSSQIEAKAALDQLQRLEQLYQKQAKELAQLRAGPVTPAAGTSLTTKNPPAEKIDGQVTQAGGDLLKLSVGSDSGLKQGHTLELFRLGAKPLYLGTVRIISLEAKAAVAKPIDKLNGAPQVGDTVSSRIGS
jgi:hypothetical protein